MTGLCRTRLRVAILTGRTARSASMRLRICSRCWVRLRLWTRGTHTGTDPNDSSDADVPVFWLGGGLVADGNAQLWSGVWANYGFYDRPQRCGACGHPGFVSDTSTRYHKRLSTPFTGTNTDGTSSNRPLGGGNLVVAGIWKQGDGSRNPVQYFNASSGYRLPLYGISPVFVVGPSFFFSFWCGPTTGRAVWIRVLWVSDQPRRAAGDIYVQQLPESSTDTVGLGLWSSAQEACRRVGFACTIAEVWAPGHCGGGGCGYQRGTGSSSTPKVSCWTPTATVSTLPASASTPTGTSTTPTATLSSGANNKVAGTTASTLTGTPTDSDGNAVAEVSSSLSFRVNSDGFFYTADGTVAAYSAGWRINADGSIFINPGQRRDRSSRRRLLRHCHGFRARRHPGARREPGGRWFPGAC